jgi:prevent-host-death family protein
MSQITSREFNQDPSKAKREASHGPVFITNRGKPAFVLVSYEEYNKIAGRKLSLVDLLAMSEVEDIDIEFDPPKLDITLKLPEFD